MMKETYFDIQIVINLLKEQESSRIDLIQNLEKQERQRWVRLVLDVLKSGRIRGIEFLKYIHQ
jgi:hypothetical protein